MMMHCKALIVKQLVVFATYVRVSVCVCVENLTHKRCIVSGLQAWGFVEFGGTGSERRSWEKKEKRKTMVWKARRNV